MPLALSTALPQQSAPPIESHQFDFWVGDWKCQGESCGPDGKPTRTEAKNTITREFKGAVVRENFRMKGLKGMSVSVYDAGAKLWRQTWVDDQGSYIALTGTFSDGKMTLKTLPKPGKTTSNRMVFSNISTDSFDWNWESSADDIHWKLAWHLHYERIRKA